MQITIYLDVIYVLNFVADFFVLWLTGILLKQKIVLWRVLAGAAFGAGMLLLFVLYPHLFMGMAGIAAYAGISMGAVAISYGGKQGGFLKRWFLSTTIMILTGSVMNYLKYIGHTDTLTLCRWLLYFTGSGACIFVIIYSLRSLTQTGEQIFRICLQHGGRQTETCVYLDTGNLLWDSLFGKPVIVLSEEAIAACLTGKEKEIIEKYMESGLLDYESLLTDKIQRRDCFHEIAFQSVGNPSGKMLCMLLEEVTVYGADRVLKRQPVAIGRGSLFAGKAYQGLLHRGCI